MSRLSLSLAGILLCSIFVGTSAADDLDEKDLIKIEESISNINADHSLSKGYSQIKANCLIRLAKWSYQKNKNNREIEQLALSAQKHADAARGEWSNTPFLIFSKDYAERWSRLSKELNRRSSSCAQPFLDCAFLSLISVEYEVSETADTEESLDEFDGLIEAAEDQAERCESADSLVTPTNSTPISVMDPSTSF